MAKVTAESMDDGLNAQQATEYLAGSEFNHSGTLVIKWDVKEVANWLVTIGFKDVVPIFQHANVNGSVLSRLNEHLLKEMGVSNVGTRIQLLQEIVRVQAVARSEWRNQVVWAGEQYRIGPCGGMLPVGFPFFCCVDECIGKPNLYTLTNSKMNVLYQRRNVNCPLMGCCGFIAESNNTDLTMIYDVDAFISTSCCVDPIGHVQISTMDGSKHLLDLRSSECQKVSTIITHTKEEAAIFATMFSLSMVR